jgi:hypothetical protein
MMRQNDHAGQDDPNHGARSALYFSRYVGGFVPTAEGQQNKNQAQTPLRGAGAWANHWMAPEAGASTQNPAITTANKPIISMLQSTSLHSGGGVNASKVDRSQKTTMNSAQMALE